MHEQVPATEPRPFPLPLRLMSVMLAGCWAAAVCAVSAAAEVAPYSPYGGRDFPEHLYWGDTHVHTNRSMDAFTMGNISATPEIAYRFARGETVTLNSGQPMRLGRPLDFVLLSDHAEWLGLFPLLAAGDERVADTGPGRRLCGFVQTGQDERTDPGHDAGVAVC